MSDQPAIQISRDDTAASTPASNEDPAATSAIEPKPEGAAAVEITLEPSRPRVGIGERWELAVELVNRGPEAVWISELTTRVTLPPELGTASDVGVVLPIGRGLGETIEQTAGRLEPGARTTAIVTVGAERRPGFAARISRAFEGRPGTYRVRAHTLVWPRPPALAGESSREQGAAARALNALALRISEELDDPSWPQRGEVMSVRPASVAQAAGVIEVALSPIAAAAGGALGAVGVALAAALVRQSADAILLQLPIAGAAFALIAGWLARFNARASARFDLTAAVVAGVLAALLVWALAPTAGG